MMFHVLASRDLPPWLGASILWFSIASALSALSWAEDDVVPGTPLVGSEVVERVNEREDGVHLSQNLEIVVTDAKGRERKREARVYRRYDESGKQSLIRYQAPSSVRGTGFLTFDYRDGREDKQWLYLPELRRTRRISASDRGERFLGTDFTYNDIKNELKIEAEDYSFSFLGWKDFGDCRCAVVEGTVDSVATARELGHTRARWWVDPTNWMPLKAEFFQGETIARTVRARGVRQVQGIWTAHELHCADHESDGLSTFRFSEIDYETPLGADLFSQEALRRDGSE